MLTDYEVRQAVEFESHDAPVLSVYLNVDPCHRTVEGYRLALRGLLEQAEEASAEDVRRIQSFIEIGYNRSGRGIVMFSCAAKDFWWAQSVAVPVEDFVFVSFRPYVRQLARLLDTYERCGVVHVDQEGARLYLFNMGELEAADGYLGTEVKQHRSGGWANPRLQRHENTLARRNLQESAELAEAFYRDSGTRRLFLAGTEKNVARFNELLSHRLRRMVLGHFHADANATPTEIRNKALELAAAAETREAAALAEELLATAQQGGNAVLGLVDTLTAIQHGRARHLVALTHYSEQAYRFVDSGLVVLTLGEEGDLASGRIQDLPDAVESALRRALAQSLAVTLVDQHPGLAQAGGIGALTRW